jgi:hypothetical protein
VRRWRSKRGCAKQKPAEPAITHGHHTIHAIQREKLLQNGERRCRILEPWWEVWRRGAISPVARRPQRGRRLEVLLGKRVDGDRHGMPSAVARALRPKIAPPSSCRMLPSVHGCRHLSTRVAPRLLRSTARDTLRDPLLPTQAFSPPAPRSRRSHRDPARQGKEAEADQTTGQVEKALEEIDSPLIPQTESAAAE